MEHVLLFPVHLVATCCSVKMNNSTKDLLHKESTQMEFTILVFYWATQMILNNNNHNVNKHKPRLMYIIDGIFR